MIIIINAQYKVRKDHHVCAATVQQIPGLLNDLAQAEQQYGSQRCDPCDL